MTILPIFSIEGANESQKWLKKSIFAPIKARKLILTYGIDLFESNQKCLLDKLPITIIEGAIPIKKSEISKIEVEIGREIAFVGNNEG